MPRRRYVPLLQRLIQLRPDLDDPEMLIRTGQVTVDGIRVINPRALVPQHKAVSLLIAKPLRGQLKLHAALERFEIEVHGATALDAGAAAGGFTQALVEAGVRRVYAIDAGHGQLRGSLRLHPSVVSLERTNIADLTIRVVPDVLNVVTLDLSYVSLAEAVPQLNRLSIAENAVLIALIKPMFELGLPTLPPTERWPDAVEHASRGIALAGWKVLGVVRSEVLGRRGAVEFLLHASRRSGGLGV
jgi:23S rRNA (cytidine1920-2'-O)/16S rRNA (cytidine1409-2'-O)-methyltransferase